MDFFADHVAVEEELFFGGGKFFLFQGVQDIVTSLIVLPNKLFEVHFSLCEIVITQKVFTTLARFEQMAAGEKARHALSLRI